MLQETEEALQAKLHFQTVYDLYPAIEAVQDGAVLRVRQLHAVAMTLKAAQDLGSQLKRPQDSSGNGSVDGEGASQENLAGSVVFPFTCTSLLTTT